MVCPFNCWVHPGIAKNAVQALLLGLEDPPCNAHGENESLDLADFRKAVLSVAHLVAELSEAKRA